MKKIIISFFIILSIFSLLYFSHRSSPNTNSITPDKIDITIGQSDKFSDKEINDAIDCVVSNFSFPACTLTKIWYDEEKSNTVTNAYIACGRGSENGAVPENVIVLLSEFYVDDSGDNPVLEADSTYSDYNWILKRDSKTSSWKIDDSGY